MDRRYFIKTSAVAGAALLTPFGWKTVHARSVSMLEPLPVPKYARSLPIPGRIDLTGGGTINMSMKPTAQDLLGLGGQTGVWGYGPGAVTYPGPTIVAARDRAIQVQWINELWTHPLPVDTSIHLANPTNLNFPTQSEWSVLGIPVVPHLHGGRNESASDGLPEAWWTPGETAKGNFFEKTLYTYDNMQEAATLWYHDHALGITRLNVYAGLAGFYLLRDDNERELIDNNILPGGEYELEIAIQDRMFTVDGELYYPFNLDEFYAEEELEEITFPRDRPSVLPEFFGNVILVNGAAWPKLDVEPRKYRFRLLNGSDSRFYILEFHDSRGTPANFLQIGTDNGFLERPVVISSLLLAPGERADVVFDFSKLWGSSVHVRNFGPDEPFKGFGIGEPADPGTTGQIMRFDVLLPLSDVPEAAVQPGRTRLRADSIPQWNQYEKQAVRTRQVALFEGTDQYHRLQPLLGVAEPTEDVTGDTVIGSLAWFDPITENPELDDIEVWEIYNATEDAHPIHVHLVKFLILDRQPFSAEIIEKDQPEHGGETGTGGILTDIELIGNARRAERNERGWKDTVVAFPEEVTRIAAKFDREGRYVWHCHILSHEDHEMMRPYQVGPVSAKEAIASAASGDFNLTSSPNPFNPTTTIRFELPQGGNASLEVYDVSGRRVAQLVNGPMEAGRHQVRFDATHLASGLYLSRLTMAGQVVTGKMNLVK